jgi:hypothetical protein
MLRSLSEKLNFGTIEIERLADLIREFDATAKSVIAELEHRIKNSSGCDMDTMEKTDLCEEQLLAIVNFEFELRNNPTVVSSQQTFRYYLHKIGKLKDQFESTYYGE